MFRWVLLLDEMLQDVISYDACTPVFSVDDLPINHTPRDRFRSKHQPHQHGSVVALPLPVANIDGTRQDDQPVGSALLRYLDVTVTSSTQPTSYPRAKSKKWGADVDVWLPFSSHCHPTTH
jgi:hypothetical protein